MRLPGPPLPKQIEAISVTGAELLRSCWLRLCFTHSAPHKELQLVGPGTRLGTVTHKLIEQAAKGAFAGLGGPDLELALSLSWEKGVAAQVEQARSSPANQHLTCPERWPYYEIKRARAIRFARRIALNVSVPPQSHQRLQLRTEDSRPVSERWYSGFAGRLHGRADRTLGRDGETIVVDYKTGKIAEINEAGDEEIRPAYRRQLMLYAALHHDAAGAWPAYGELVPLDGEPRRIEIDRSEAVGLVSETLGLLDHYNSVLDSELLPPANPSPENCAFCPFQGMCDAYWSNVQPAWAGPRSASIAGTVVGILGQSQADHTIKVEVLQGDQPPGLHELRRVIPHRFTDCGQVREGTRVRIVRANPEGERASSVLLPTDTTELWRQSDDLVPSPPSEQPPMNASISDD